MEEVSIALGLPVDLSPWPFGTPALSGLLAEISLLFSPPASTGKRWLALSIDLQTGPCGFGQSGLWAMCVHGTVPSNTGKNQ